MKAGQYFALIAGILFLLVGIMGFIPNLVESPVSNPEVSSVFDRGFGYIMGVIPTNVIHNMIRCLFGVAGILSSISLDSTRTYCRALAVFYGLFAIFGLFPYTNTLFGSVPIYGSDVLLHGLSAAIGAYFGFFASPGLLEISDKSSQNV
jgi:hypothetical protein